MFEAETFGFDASKSDTNAWTTCNADPPTGSREKPLLTPWQILEEKSLYRVPSWSLEGSTTKNRISYVGTSLARMGPRMSSRHIRRGITSPLCRISTSPFDLMSKSMARMGFIRSRQSETPNPSNSRFDSALATSEGQIVFGYIRAWRSSIRCSLIIPVVRESVDFDISVQHAGSSCIIFAPSGLFLSLKEHWEVDWDEDTSRVIGDLSRREEVLFRPDHLDFARLTLEGFRDKFFSTFWPTMSEPATRLR